MRAVISGWTSSLCREHSLKENFSETICLHLTLSGENSEFDFFLSISTMRTLSRNVIYFDMLL